MVLGVGIDLAVIAEIKAQIDELEHYVSEVFTANEIAYCSKQANPYASFAARFAAKEAFMKAAGTGWTKELDFLEIEILRDGDTRPTLHLTEGALDSLKSIQPFTAHVSLSHTDAIATAVVVLDKG